MFWLCGKHCIDDSCKVLAGMPNLHVLTLTGNPFMRNVENYRKTMIFRCKELSEYHTFYLLDLYLLCCSDECHTYLPIRFACVVFLCV